jgi:hypothetical protein
MKPSSWFHPVTWERVSLNKHKKEKQMTKQIVPSYFSGLCHSMKQNKDLMQEKEANQTSAKTFVYVKVSINMGSRINLNPHLLPFI